MWSWLFGSKKGQPAPPTPARKQSKVSLRRVASFSASARIESVDECLQASESCCACCPGIEEYGCFERRKVAPRLGVDRWGRPVTPHACDLDSTPSAVRLQSTSSVSTVPARRPTVKSHKCERGASSSDPLGPQFAQFKSPTAPRYRPTVTPHYCPLGDGLDGADHRKGSGSGSGKAKQLLKWLLLALLLLAVAGTAAGPTLLAFAKKKCLDSGNKPC